MSNARSFEFQGQVQTEEKAFYEENGFIVYRQMVSPGEVRLLRREANSYQRRALNAEIPSADIDTVAPITYDQSGKPMLHHRLNYFTRYCEGSRQIVVSERFAALAEGLGGPDHWLLEDTMNGVVWQIKTGGEASRYSAIRWHFDFPVNHPLSPAFTVGIYLDDSKEYNGCLAVVPKSHRNPVGLVVPEPLHIEVEAGDVICHHERLYHGSGAVQIAENHRATIYLYFCGGTYPGPDLPFADENHLKAIQRIFTGAHEAGHLPQ